MGCTIEIHPEAVSGFLEIRPSDPAKAALKSLLLCEVYPIDSSNGALRPADAIDAEYARIHHPALDIPTWGLRVYGHFAIFQPLDGWVLKEDLASLQHTFVIQIVDVNDIDWIAV